MHSYLNITGREIKAGALMLTGAFSGEMEPIDRVFEEDTPGVWTAGGSVFLNSTGANTLRISAPRGSKTELSTIGMMTPH